MTVDEKLAVKAKAEQAGVTSSEFVRRCALGEEIVATLHTPSDPAQMAEVRSVGERINQIAKTLNEGGHVAPDVLTTALADFDRILDGFED